MTRNIPHRARSRERGFTIVELIVAMGVFTVLVTIAVGVFVNAVRNQRRLTALMAVNNNVGGVLEQMAREMRTGYRFLETQNPAAPCGLIASNVQFTNYASNLVHYCLTENGEVARREAGAVGVNDGQWLPMTASEVEVTYLSFIVTQRGVSGGAADDVCNPWRVTITMGVRPRGDDDAARETKLQTTVSSRVLPSEAPGAPEEIVQLCRR